MLPDRVSNPGPLTYESGALPIALRGPATILFNFESTSCKNHSDTNLVKIQNPVIEILSCMFCAIFSNSSHLGIPNCKKIQWIHTRNILAQRWINFNQWVLRYCHFRVYNIFCNSPWRPSWIVNLHKYEIVPFGDHCDQI